MSEAAVATIANAAAPASASSPLPLHRFDLVVTLQAPYLVHGNDPGRLGLHATQLRDHRRRPVLPGSLLAGRIAEVWRAHADELIGETDDELGARLCEQWIGSSGADERTGEGRRARLRVADLVLTTIDGQPFDPKAATVDFDLSRIAIDDDTGSVAPGALLMVEQVSRPGALLEFRGQWQARTDDRSASRLRDLLWAALLAQTQLGAWRNIGFGRVVCVRVDPSEVAAAPEASIPRKAWPSDLQRHALTTTDALCLAASTTRGNVFDSADFFSGATLKGALARMLCERYGAASIDALTDKHALARHFGAIRITHALPAKADGGRPVPLPLSLVSLSDGQIRDAVALGEPPANARTSIAFQTDWKGSDHATGSAGQGWGDTERHLRVRTAIDADGKAASGQLFAYNCRVAPLDEAGEPLTRWLCDIDLAAVPPADRAEVAGSLDQLLAGGVSPLGKTDASAQIARCDVGPVWPCGTPRGLGKGALVPLMLVTPALLFAVSEIEGIEPPAKVDLFEVYAKAFGALQRSLELALPGGQSAAAPQTANPPLRYRHHFATQRLAGGEFLHRRYGRDQPYRPLVLTQAGSVFVFEVVDVERARRVLAHWQRHGLELPDAVVAVHGGDWTRHPYLRQNGYGEVAIGLQHGFAPLSA